MSTKNLRFLRYPTLLLAITLLIAVGTTMLWGIRSLADSAAQVEHSYRVILTLERVQSAVRTGEAAARGYRRTRMPSLHAEYLAQVPVVLSGTGVLLELAKDDPARLAEVRELQAAVQERLEELDRLVNATDPQAPGGDAIAHDIRYGHQRSLTSSVAQTRHGEERLLAQRSEVRAEQARRLAMLVLVGIVVPLVLLGLTLRGLVGENRSTRRLERDARKAVQRLEASVVQLDRLSEQRRVLARYGGMLQSCESLEEALALTGTVLADLLPNAGGRCYVLRRGEGVGETAVRFGAESVESREILLPGQCWALRRGHSHRIDRRHGHVACAHLDRDAVLDDRWSLCVPLASRSGSLGMLHVNGFVRDGDPGADGEVVEAVAEQLGLTMVSLELRESLRLQSIRDALTGLFNRRYLEESLRRELLRCQRRDLPLSVLMIDVDHFKRFNDENGHAAGDALLAKLGEVLLAQTRGEDIACRYGGEEFTVVLPGLDAATACRRAEEIREAVATMSVAYLQGTLSAATASIGVATFPDSGATSDALLRAADQALYRAKNSGRNRVLVAEPADAISGTPAAPATH